MPFLINLQSCPEFISLQPPAASPPPPPPSHSQLLPTATPFPNLGIQLSIKLGIHKSLLDTRTRGGKFDMKIHSTAIYRRQCWRVRCGDCINSLQDWDIAVSISNCTIDCQFKLFLWFTLHLHTGSLRSQQIYTYCMSGNFAGVKNSKFSNLVQSLASFNWMLSLCYIY